MIDPILITGCARSGTSMVAGSINLCGAFGGRMSGPNQNNKKGMFENHEIRQRIVKPFLRQLGVDPMGQFPLARIEKLVIPTNWRNQIEAVFRRQGYKRGSWFYKGAKACQIWPVWHYAFPNAKWIIVRRKTGDIIRSCLKTGFMRAFRSRNNCQAIGVENEWEGWRWWVRKHEQLFVEMINAGLNCKIVWPERMVDGDYHQMMETIDWLGLKWNSEVMNFIEPKLWKARRR